MLKYKQFCRGWNWQPPRRHKINGFQHEALESAWEPHKYPSVRPFQNGLVPPWGTVGNPHWTSLGTFLKYTQLSEMHPVTTETYWRPRWSTCMRTSTWGIRTCCWSLLERASLPIDQLLEPEYLQRNLWDLLQTLQSKTPASLWRIPGTYSETPTTSYLQTLSGTARTFICSVYISLDGKSSRIPRSSPDLLKFQLESPQNL